MARRLALAALLAAVPASAADVVVVAPEPMTGPYAEAFKGVCDALGACPPRLAPGDEVPEGTRAVIALGGRAARQRLPAKTVLVTALTPGFEARRPGDAPLVRVRMTPSPADFVKRLLRLRPDAKRLALFWSSDTSGRFSTAVLEEGRGKGLDVVGVEVGSAADLPASLRSAPKMDALWLAPDPELVTPEVFAEVAECARARGATFYSPAPGLTDHDADPGLAPSFRAAGASAGAAAREALAGRLNGGAVYPEEPLIPPLSGMAVSSPTAPSSR